MKPFNFVLGLVCFVLAACTQVLPSKDLPIEPQASTWSKVGDFIETNISRDVSLGWGHSIAVFHGNPVVVWSEHDGTSYNALVKRWNGSAWVPVGGLLDVNPDFHAVNADIALDTSGNPVVAWSEGWFAGDSNVYVKRWNGLAWVQLGNALNISGSNATEPSIALDGSGNPVVAWIEAGPSFDIYVKRWNGSSWVQLGVALDIDASQNALSPSLAVEQSGNPVVSWGEFDGSSYKVFVKRWSGSTWMQLGTSLNISENSRLNSVHSSLVVDFSSNPVVAWSECDSTDASGNCLNFNVYVKRWDGSSWVQLPEALDVNVSNQAENPSLAFDAMSRLVVVWHEGDSLNKKLYVKRWTGTTWVSLGLVQDGVGYGSAVALDSSGNPFVVLPLQRTTFDTDLYVKQFITNVWLLLPATDRNLSRNATETSAALRNNNTVGVAWQEDDGNSFNIYASFWNGDTWVRYGGALDTTLANPSTSPSLAFKSNNFPVVAYQEQASNNNNIFVKQWNGSAWMNYGTGVALDRNVNNNAYAPSLVLDSTDNPYVAWYETVNGNNNIYVKRWDSVNNTWVNVGNALDTTLANQSTNPSLAIDSMNRPVVAWQECRAIDLLGECTWSDIHVKRWNGTSWEFLGDIRTVVALSINPSLTIDAMDIPIVAYQEDNNIRVKRWNGSLVLGNWNFLGTTLDRFASDQASNPSIDVRTDGNPVVAWTEVMFETTTNSFYSYLFVKRWNGISWVNMASSSLNRSKVQNASFPSLAVGSNNSINIGHQEWDGISINLYVTRF